MKIKCPFCKNIYDPEACDSTCPACGRKLLVTVFKKKPEGKPGAGPATVFKATLPKTEASDQKPESGGAPAVAPPAHQPAAAPALPAEVPAAAPKAPKIVMPPSEPPPPAAAPAPAEPAAHPHHAPHAEKKHMTQRVQARASMDLVISIQRGSTDAWDAVIRVPVHVFKVANLIPARAREAIEAEGIDFAELRKAAEHAEHAGPVLDIQTQTERVHIAIAPHS